MSAARFVADLLQRGMMLWVENGKLRYRASKGSLTPAAREELVQHKADIVALLDGGIKWAPASFAQERLWFLDRLDPGSAAYNIPSAVHLAGPLDETILTQVLNEIVRRHEALRTTFGALDGRPVQMIAPATTLSLLVVDLSELPEAEREIQVRRLARQDAGQPFDLVHGPLVRVTLLRLDKAPSARAAGGGSEWDRKAEHVLLLNMHHIVSDGWSMEVLVREIATLYEAFALRSPSPLPELPLQYVDFALWQRQWLAGEALEELLTYWKEQLESSLPALELPTDRPRPPLQTFRGATLSFTLSLSLTKRLKSLSQEQGCTLFMTLLAAFQALLHRYTGQGDIVVGSPIANRNRAEIEGLIGFFVNTLALRTDLSGDPTFRELLGQVREVTLEAYAHQDVPFEMLVEELQPERDLSRPPLFQVMFVLQNAPQEPLALPGLTLTPLAVDGGTAKFDLTLSMIESAEGLSGSLEYNVDLFDAATIKRMARHFRRLLEGILADPDQPISRLPLLTEVERDQLLIQWNDTLVDYPLDRCAHQLFEMQAAHAPDAVATTFEGDVLTYRELNRRANQLAHYLRKLRVGPETLVGICVERSLEMVVGLMGVLKAGGAYVPIDPVYPSERLAFILEDTGAPVLLTQAHLIDRLPSHKARLVCLDAELYTRAIAQECDENPVSDATPANLVYVIYTSGSTGWPKGTLLTHRGLCNLATAYVQDLHIGPDTCLLQFFSFGFDGSVADIFSALLSGASLCLPRRETVVSMLDLHHLMQEQAVTHLLMTPSALAVLPADGLPALQSVLSGGESCTREIVTRWSLGRDFINAYGPTETTVVTSWYSVGELSEELTNIPIGSPIANTCLYILDRHLQPMSVGLSGELCAGGVGVARGYLNRPELTAERFIPDPFSKVPGTRLYRTGDLARYLPDGNIEFLGRFDFQVKVRGYRIELGEIEAVLGQHLEVREAAVLVREDVSESKQLVAYVVPTDEGQRTRDKDTIVGSLSFVSELRDLLQQKLPGYMVPSAFVTLEALPLTPNGKVDRRALPAPDRADLDLAETLIAPRDVLELKLTQIWEDVLGVHPIGVNHNFFELGGHSLLAVRLMARIQQELGLELPLATLFQAGTVQQLAPVLRQHKEIGGSFSSLVPMQTGNSNNRPLFFVHSAGGNVLCYADLVRHLGPEQPFYGLQAVGLNGEQQPHARVETMASHYVELLQTVQAQGPYLLGGWSMGGLVAFEMAQQLQAQGQTVALLILIDSHAPTGEQEPQPDDIALLAGWAMDMGLRLDQVAFEWGRLGQFEPDERLGYVLEEAKRAGAVPADIALTQVRHLFQVFKRNVQALRRYEPHVYSGPLTLFKAGERPGERPFTDDLGWGELSSSGVTVHVVPGNHYTLLREPNVKALAGQLKHHLQAIETIRAPVKALVE